MYVNIDADGLYVGAGIGVVMLEGITKVHRLI